MSTSKTPGEVCREEFYKGPEQGSWERAAAAVIAYHEAQQVLTREQAKESGVVLGAIEGRWEIVVWIAEDFRWGRGPRAWRDEKFTHFRRLPEVPK